MEHYLTVGGAPYCRCLGHQAGRERADATGVDICGYPTKREATAAARKLRTVYVAVAVVPGICPETSAEG